MNAINTALVWFLMHMQLNLSRLQFMSLDIYLNVTIIVEYIESFFFFFIFNKNRTVHDELREKKVTSGGNSAR